MDSSSRTFPGNDAVPDEQTVLDDIAWFETRLRQLREDGGDSPRDPAALQVCALLLRQRRQLLAALRDGAPEKWPAYAPGGKDD